MDHMESKYCYLASVIDYMYYLVGILGDEISIRNTMRSTAERRQLAFKYCTFYSLCKKNIDMQTLPVSKRHKKRGSCSGIILLNIIKYNLLPVNSSPYVVVLKHK